MLLKSNNIGVVKDFSNDFFLFNTNDQKNRTFCFCRKIQAYG